METLFCLFNVTSSLQGEVEQAAGSKDMTPSSGHKLQAASEMPQWPSAFPNLMKYRPACALPYTLSISLGRILNDICILIITRCISSGKCEVCCKGCCKDLETLDPNIGFKAKKK